jgi:hypothetical protein
MIWLLAHPLPPFSPVSQLDKATQKNTVKERQVAHGRWREGVGEEPNHPIVKAWSSINHSILSGLTNDHVEYVYCMCENWFESGMYSTVQGNLFTFQ